MHIQIQIQYTATGKYRDNTDRGIQVNTKTDRQIDRYTVRHIQVTTNTYIQTFTHR